MDTAVLATHNRSHRVAHAQHEHAELLRDAALALDPDTRCTSCQQVRMAQDHEATVLAVQKLAQEKVQHGAQGKDGTVPQVLTQHKEGQRRTKRHMHKRRVPRNARHEQEHSERMEKLAAAIHTHSDARAERGAFLPLAPLSKLRRSECARTLGGRRHRALRLHTRRRRRRQRAR